MKKVIYLIICCTTILTLIGCGNNEEDTQITEGIESENVLEQDAIPDVENSTEEMYDSTNLTERRTHFLLTYYAPNNWNFKTSDSSNDTVYYYPYEEIKDGFIIMSTESIGNISEFNPDVVIKNVEQDFVIEQFRNKTTVDKKVGYKVKFSKQNDNEKYESYMYIIPCGKNIYYFGIVVPEKLETYQLNYLDSFVSKCSINEKSLAEALEEENETKLKFTTNDYFSDVDRRTEYKELIKQGKYNEIYANAKEYIDNESPDKKNSAYIIVEWLEPIIEQWDDICVEYDKIDEVAKIYYKNVKDISKNIHIVPYCTTDSRAVNIVLGFIENDWIFFDNITIKTDSDEVTIYPYREDKVLKGGKIQEKTIEGDLKPEKLLQIANSEDTIIRFENVSSEEKYDYTVSDEEKKALKIMADMYGIYNNLSDLAFAYENGMVFDLNERSVIH